ncbi:MAG: c-type cytochrome biogenesis protein CcmI [Gammaproteobacteria bacterium]|nr:c-type cytochrome biogenesis protein CcmI [Gammaproteobacteria bacterium]
MMTFLIVAGVLTALALLFLLPSLLGKGKAMAAIDRDSLNASIARERLAALEAEFEQGAMDEASYQIARDEIERGLLDDIDAQGEQNMNPGGAMSHWSPIVVAVLVPALSIWIYLQLGEPDAIERNARAPQAASVETHGGNPHNEGDASNMPPIADLAAKLAAKMEQDPENLEGWVMLGRTYDVLEQYANAASAYEMARSLSPEDPDLMVSLAEAQAMSSQGSLQGQPRELIDQALKIQPQHGKALWYAGMSRFQTGTEYREAVDMWMLLLMQMDESTEAYAQVAEIIREAAGHGGFEPPLAAQVDTLPSIQAPPMMAQAQTQPESPQQPAATDGAAIKVTVRLGDGMADKIAPGDTLFVYARALEGPRMPLAIVRVTAADLPFDTELNDAQAMMPAMRLSNFPQVVVGARVSRSGQAIAQPGDVFGEVSPVDVAAGSNVQIVIDQVK